MDTDFTGGAAYAESLSASSEDDEFPTDSSDDSDDVGSEDEQRRTWRKSTSAELGLPNEERTATVAAHSVNLVHKLYNRERTGSLVGDGRRRYCRQTAFEKVPKRLSFCLREAVPQWFLHGHIIMGLSACGQFLLSYKVCLNDNVAANHYSFNIGYKYTLYFLLFQPHQPPRKYYQSCLFDDHGVDNLKKVTMTQWKCSDPRVLIVHGGATDENEDSYITYVKVPKLGCLDCKKLQDFEEPDGFREHALCLKCNLTVHTKYSTSESDRKFNAYMNLLCPERILVVANGFLHMLHIDLEQPAAVGVQHTPNAAHSPLTPFILPRATPPYEPSGDNQHNNNNIVARIIADFSDIETDSTASSGSRHPDTPPTATPSKFCDELIFTCNGSAASALSVSAAGCSGGSPIAGGGGGGSAKVNLISHRGRRHHRIVTKSYRNGVVTVDMQGSTTTPAVVDKANAYEFSEDNEKCEKIATLRKRRLADKKYEFSEDNSENIVPFTKVRSASKSTSKSLFGSSPSGPVAHAGRSLHRSPAATHHFNSSPCASPSSSPHPSHASSSGCDSRHCTPPPLHRASPIAALQQGFRSPPCSSPVGVGAGAVMRSPSRHVTAAQIYGQKSPPPPLPSLSLATQQMLSFKPLGTLSPLQVSMAKRNHIELSGSSSPNANVPFLSPRREEMRIVEVPLQGGATSEKPVCTKKFKRRYVEEDDAASVITSEEDDCISPGYHTSLPMEVHGTCYAEMQMISQASYHQLHCASVVVTQHSFDLEAFTYYVIGALCQKNHKTYEFFYDWAYELISVCPLSQTIVCLLMAQFIARDQLPSTPTHCLNCLRKLDCAFHRRQFECRILFTWNMESGEWDVLDFGELLERNITTFASPIKRSGGQSAAPLSLAKAAKKLAAEMSASLAKVQDYTHNLRVLDSNVKKSKAELTDHDNMIEFTLKRARNRD